MLVCTVVVSENGLGKTVATTEEMQKALTLSNADQQTQKVITENQLVMKLLVAETGYLDL